MKSHALSVAVFVALCAAAPALQTRPDFSGTWHAVRIENHGQSLDVPPGELDLRLRVDATTLTLIQANDPATSRVYKLNGTETKIGDEISHASWVGSTIVIDSVAGDAKIKSKSVMSIDAAGFLIVESTVGPPMGDGTPTRTICRRVTTPVGAASAQASGASDVAAGFVPPAGFVLDPKATKTFDFSHEAISYPKRGGGGNENIDPEGKMWVLRMNIVPPNKTGDASDAAMRAALKAQGWEFYTASGTLIAHRVNAGKTVWFKGAAFAGDYRATIIEVGPAPHTLALPLPTAAVETLSDAADFPYLLKFPGSTLKRTQLRPGDTVDATVPGGPGEQLVGSGTVEKDYDLPANVSTYEFMVVYRDALTRAGWTVLRTAAGSDALVVAHFAKNGRDIYAYLHGDVFKVADVGAASAAKKLADALAKEGHVAIYGIYFDVDKSVLKPESETALQHILELLNAAPTMSLEVQGHTDSTGNAPHNQALSDARAASVKAWLVAHGVAAARLTPKGYGDSQPVGDNKTPDGRAKNRRVELKK